VPVLDASVVRSGEDRWYSRLHETLESGRFALTAEIGPPRGATVAGIRRKARLLRDWVDAANVTDGQSAVVRLASWAGSLAMMQEGLEPVMQLQCRDRNRIALQADLLGAAALGIPNVLLLTGDHQRFGDHPEAKPVFDLDSVQLVWTARTLRDQRRLLSGRRLSAPPRWLIGAVENPFAPPRRFRAERLGKKIAAGAQFVQTQFIFDVPVFARWMEQVRDLGLHERCFVLAGVGPVRSLRALEHMRREVPGIHVPDDVVRRLQGAPEDQIAAEGIALCAETIQQLREIPGVAGVHIMAFGWEEAVPEILERAGLDRRPPSRVESCSWRASGEVVPAQPVPGQVEGVVSPC
jgi:methylenetetrahydrofolate reductase (NADPH)